MCICSTIEHCCGLYGGFKGIARKSLTESLSLCKKSIRISQLEKTMSVNRMYLQQLQAPPPGTVLKDQFNPVSVTLEFAFSEPSNTAYGRRPANNQFQNWRLITEEALIDEVSLNSSENTNAIIGVSTTFTPIPDLKQFKSMSELVKGINSEHWFAVTTTGTPVVLEGPDFAAPGES